jgi:hydroxymethylpyrimidine pyrophosphatase-like HAD family hydrolase
MVITDLDGTLFQKDHRISKRNYQTLLDLGDRAVVRVIATGRNLFSAYKVLPREFPIDFLVFSSGAGIMAWSRQELLFSASMNEAEVTLAFEALSRRSLDFMVHLPIPENHHFLYFASDQPNPDFEARCKLYADFATPGRKHDKPPGEACQLVAIEPFFRSASYYPEIREELDRLTVVRTTSPLDHRSRWIEIFCNQVSKAQASLRIAHNLGIQEERIVAIGNDYNDLDLLRWAARSFVVNNAPGELLARFPVVRTGDESDFSEAVALWRREMKF